MKKSLGILILWIIISSVSWSKDHFAGNAAITTNFSIDDKYGEIYGPIHIGIDLNGNWTFFDHFFFYSGIGLLPAWGTIPELNDHATSIQIFLRAGIGYTINLSHSFQFKLRFGGAGIYYYENAMETSASKIAVGFDGGLEFLIKMEKKSYVLFFSDYIYSRDSFKDEPKQPGGLRMGIGIGKYF